MSLICPSCGTRDFDTNKQCICGYNADESFITESFVREPKIKNKEKIKVEVQETPVDLKRIKQSEEIVIKEVDSWVFSFSQEENYVYLGTPALQSFRLKITLNDLEELLEFMYQKTGEEKTTRKLRLSVDEIPDLIGRVYNLIEEKKSKVKINFSSDELKEIVDLINIKLKQ